MKEEDYISHSSEAAALLCGKIGLSDAERLAFEVMGVGVMLLGDGYHAEVMTVDSDYRDDNDGKKYKVKVFSAPLQGFGDREEILDGVEDKFGYTSATAEDVNNILDEYHLYRRGSCSPSVMLEAGIPEAVMYRVLLSFVMMGDEPSVFVESYLAIVQRGNIRWTYDRNKWCSIEETRKILLDIAKETWDASMDYIGETDNHFD